MYIIIMTHTYIQIFIAKGLDHKLLQHNYSYWHIKTHGPKIERYIIQ